MATQEERLEEWREEMKREAHERPCPTCGGSGVVGRGPDEGNCPMCNAWVEPMDEPFDVSLYEVPYDPDKGTFPAQWNVLALVPVAVFVALAFVLGWVGR